MFSGRSSVLKQRICYFLQTQFQYSKGNPSSLISRLQCTSAMEKESKKRWEAIIYEKERKEELSWETNKHTARQSLVSPLLQVFSVSLLPQFEVHTPCDIYGSIRAIEGRVGGSTFTLYDRSACDAETIFADGKLSLIGPEHCPILCSIDSTVSLDLYLKDRSRGNALLNTHCLLSSKTEDFEHNCDKLIKAFVQGQHGFAALVHYTTFRFAVFATVVVALIEKFDKTCPSADIHGSIVAEYANTQLCYSNDDLKLMKTVLFNKPSDQSVKAMVNTPLELSRWVVAVPAHATLRIELDLWDSKSVFASGSAEFLALKLGHSNKCIVGDRGVIFVVVHFTTRVVENKGYYLRYQFVANALIHPYFTRYKRLSSTVSSKRLFSTVSSKRLFSTVSSMEDEVRAEVFSIYVCGSKQAVSALCGTVDIEHSTIDYVFERDLSSPELLSPSKSILPLEVHGPVDNCQPSVTLKLWDPIHDLEIANGSTGWCDVGLNPWSRLSYYDHRLCCLVKGEDGYAAMHYMIIERAYAARVEVFFLFNDPTVNVAIDVSGSIFARYSGHDYSTNYDKKYFRSRLFDRPHGDQSAQLAAQSSLPLMKSFVAVPIDSSLIIDADLCIMGGIGCSNNEIFFGSVEFGTDGSTEVCKEIRGTNCRMVMSVLYH